MKLTHSVSLGGLLVVLASVAGGCGEGEETRVAVPVPTPVPSETPQPAKRAVPSATPDNGSIVVTGPLAEPTRSGVTGGGPSGGAEGSQVTGGGLSGDPEAVIRIDAQLPVFAGAIVLDGKQALSYMPKLVSAFPALGGLSIVIDAANCAFNHGLVAMRVYILPDYSHAGAVGVISRSQLEPGTLGVTIAKCLATNVLNGGPGFNPCFTSYSIENQVNGVTDHYWVFVGATYEQFCDAVRQSHANFNVQPISF